VISLCGDLVWVILPKSGVPIARTMVCTITEAELQTDSKRSDLEDFDRAINNKLGDHNLTEQEISFEIESSELQQALADQDNDGNYIPFEPDSDLPEMDYYDEETLDRLLSAELLLPKGNFQFVAKVISRKRDHDGQPVGRSNCNPILDTRVYEVEFPGGTISEHSANVLAEALYSQVDIDGNRFLLLKEIVEHEKDANALFLDDARNPTKRLTTKGWKFLCMWADGSSPWEPL
jgi:hypothetical protein